MTIALCLACGQLKRGAFVGCPHCGAEADPDRGLTIALSDHRMSAAGLERIGRVIQDLAAVSDDAEVREVAFRLFMRDHMEQRLEHPLPPELQPRAAEILAAISLPKVRFTSSRPGGGDPSKKRSPTNASVPSDAELTTIDAAITRLVSAEDPLQPLSDQELKRRLGEEGIAVPRRVVAKRRASLGIASSSRRKRA